MPEISVDVIMIVSRFLFGTIADAFWRRPLGVSMVINGTLVTDVIVSFPQSPTTPIVI
jgi:hypothetical protein